MELNDLYEAGSDIMDAVSDAVSRNDYSHLSDDIRKTVDELRVQIRREMPDGDVRRGSGRYAYRRPAANNNVYRSRQTAGSRKADEKFQERYAEKISHFLRKKISRQAGTGKIVLGVIGYVISRRRAKKGEGDGLPDHGFDNLVDLNDRFNRARYMNQDAEKDGEKEDK